MAELANLQTCTLETDKGMTLRATCQLQTAFMIDLVSIHLLMSAFHLSIMQSHDSRKIFGQQFTAALITVCTKMQHTA
jgi:hypothetical protein